jgi:hypothetical protein
MRNDTTPTSQRRPSLLSPIVASGRVIQLALHRDALLGLMQDSLERLALKLGMLVASSLLEDKVTRLCGRRYERRPNRTHTRYGHQRGTATVGGQKIAIARPRVRRTDGGGEVPLETYARLQAPRVMPKTVLRDPSAYLRDVVRRLPAHPAVQLDELLPSVWFASHPSARRKAAA